MTMDAFDLGFEDRVVLYYLLDLLVSPGLGWLVQGATEMRFVGFY